MDASQHEERKQTIVYTSNMSTMDETVSNGFQRFPTVSNVLPTMEQKTRRNIIGGAIISAFCHPHRVPLDVSREPRKAEKKERKEWWTGGAEERGKVEALARKIIRGTRSKGERQGRDRVHGQRQY